jgi:tetratricopeptide (TPR) repeat protein
MGAPHIQLEIEFKDYLEPLTRKSVGRARSIAEYLEEERIISHIQPPPPAYPNFSELTRKRVAEWKVSKENERVLLICMARISRDFYDLGFYDSALETINEAWECENRVSCSMSSMRNATLEFLRAKCYAQLNQFDEALASCMQAKTYGAPQVAAFERLIHGAMVVHARFG